MKDQELIEYYRKVKDMNLVLCKTNASNPVSYLSLEDFVRLITLAQTEQQNQASPFEIWEKLFGEKPYVSTKRKQIQK